MEVSNDPKSSNFRWQYQTLLLIGRTEAISEPTFGHHAQIPVMNFHKKPTYWSDLTRDSRTNPRERRHKPLKSGFIWYQILWDEILWDRMRWKVGFWAGFYAETERMFAQSNGKMIIIGKGSGTFLCQMFSVIDRSRVSDLDHITLIRLKLSIRLTDFDDFSWISELMTWALTWFLFRS